MTFDELNLFIVTGYICYMEESRHTPLRGIYFIRDVIFAILVIGLLVGEYYDGSIKLDYTVSIIAVFVIYYYTNIHFSTI